MNLGSWPLLVMNKGGHGASASVPSRCPHGPHGGSRALSSPISPPTVMRIVWPPYSVSVLAPFLRGQQKAALEQIEAGTAKHLALERLQTIDVALDRTITPG